MIVVKSTVLKSYLVIVLFQSSCDSVAPHLLRVSTHLVSIVRALSSKQKLPVNTLHRHTLSLFLVSVRCPYLRVISNYSLNSFCQFLHIFSKLSVVAIPATITMGNVVFCHK